MSASGDGVVEATLSDEGEIAVGDMEAVRLQQQCAALKRRAAVDGRPAPLCITYVAMSSAMSI